jgi:hypothetical protein
MPVNENSRRLWMFLAFIAGIVFTAALLQTLAAADAVSPASPGHHDPLTPVTVPADGSLVQRDFHGLVYAFPAREAILPG